MCIGTAARAPKRCLSAPFPFHTILSPRFRMHDLATEDSYPTGQDVLSGHLPS